MAIEKLIFTSWADAEVIFAVDWGKANSIGFSDKEWLFNFLHGVATFAVATSLGKDLNRWGTYYDMCEEFGSHLFDGSHGIVFVGINLPDIELSDEPDAIPLETMPTPPEEPSW